MEPQPSSSSVGAVDMDQFVRELRTTEYGPYITLESISMELFSILGHTPDSEAFLIGSTVKEMPCKHRFCKGCLAKSLRLKRSSPICPYTVPRVYLNSDTNAVPSGREEHPLLVILMACFMFLLSFFYSWAKMSISSARDRYGFN